MDGSDVGKCGGFDGWVEWMVRWKDDDVWLKL